MSSQILPVPAIFNKNNLIEYYTYKDLRINEFLKSEKTKKEIDTYIKLSFVREIIWNDLAEKYNIEENDVIKKKTQIIEKAAYDKEINQVPINRIVSIMENIKANKNFSQAGKYSDEQGNIEIKKENLKLYNFGSKIKNLSPQEISDIIITPEGYYIFKGIKNNSREIEASYVLVRANDLNTYIERKIPTYRIWSLID
jgi:hypothetical protein